MIHKASESIQLLDILILISIRTYHDKVKKAPSKKALIELVNTVIEAYGFGEERASKISNGFTFQQHINKLREFGLITPENAFDLTQRGDEFRHYMQTTYKNIRQMPVSVPFDGTFRHDLSLFI